MPDAKAYLVTTTESGDICTSPIGPEFILIRLPNPKRERFDPGGVTADIYKDGRLVGSGGPICDTLADAIRDLVQEAVAAGAYRANAREKA